ncbi:PH domain-containing protein [Stutzerimonas urumqiensis]
MRRVYRSKVDGWLAAVLAGGAAVSALAAFGMIRTGSTPSLLVALFVLGLGVALPIWLVTSTRYILEPTQLIVRSGPFTWHIELADISDIAPSRSALSSPALSLDRLRITYARGQTLLISPRNPVGFIAEVEANRERTRHVADPGALAH